MPKYAVDTSVSVEKSRAEIESILDRYGASQFAYSKDLVGAIIMFRMDERVIKFELKLPLLADYEFTDTGRSRNENSQWVAWEQACRQRWRALALVIKAKLEAVDSGISVIEEEFLAHIVMADGDTVGEWIKPQLKEMYSTGVMPSGLLALGSGAKK